MVILLHIVEKFEIILVFSQSHKNMDGLGFLLFRQSKKKYFPPLKYKKNFHSQNGNRSPSLLMHRLTIFGFGNLTEKWVERKFSMLIFPLFPWFWAIFREGVRGVAGVAPATPFFEPENIRNFVISFLRFIDSRKKNPATPFLKS